MAKKVRTVTIDQIISISTGIAYLHNAAKFLKEGGADTTLARVRSAIKSAEGAHRHASGVYYCRQRGEG